MTTAAVQTTEAVRRLGDARRVATLLGISPRHVFRLADADKMPRPLKLGGAVRWDLDALDQWISAGCPTCREGGRRP